MIWSAVSGALARLLGRVLPFLAAWGLGKRDARHRAEIERMEADAETRKRMDDAPRFDGADDARKWLRERDE